jgi:preprotein translocase subunit SecG
MVPLLAFDSWHFMYSIPLSLVSLFLILVILVQRGRGGGLTGALGGMGGQSAFGTKAGDLFTKITIVVAAIWILLSMLAIQRLGRYAAVPQRPAATAPESGDKKDATDTKEPVATDSKNTEDGAKADAKAAGNSKPGDAKSAGTKASDDDKAKKR